MDVRRRRGERVTLPGIRRGILIEVQRRSAKVADGDGREHSCAYSPEIDLSTFSNFAVGDEVEFFPGDGAQEPLITVLLPRRNKISRPGPGERHAQELILAANVDLLVIVASATRPEFNPRLVDRYLAVAEHFEIEAVLCVNKSDLLKDLPAEAGYLRGIGYKVFSSSAETGAGIEELRACLRGRLSVFSGASGVGKSSLAKVLMPGLETRIGDVRPDGRGRHTTTTSRLYSEGGIRFIDTPGIRELGLWGVHPSALTGLWRDFRPFQGKCRFTDCGHRTEPGCAVLEAVRTGIIPDFRLQSYYRVVDTQGMEP